MFILDRNNFLVDGTCHYVDERKNTIFIKRINESVYRAKVRIADCDINFEPVTIDVNDKNSEVGIELPLKSAPLEKGMDFERDNTSLINDISDIFSRWWQMLRDIQEFINAQKSHIAEKEMMQYVAKLLKYEELGNVVRTLFSDMIVAPKA